MHQAYIDTSNARLWTVQQGSGPPLVWCHGGPGLWDYLGPVAELTAAYTTTYRYDQRGCGRSSGGGPHTIASHLDDLDALRRYFGHDKWIVGGHSWGAMLALLYALENPSHTAGLIYLSGVGVNPSWRKDFEHTRSEVLGPELIVELQRLRSCAAASGSLADERAFCELQWSCDFVHRATAREQARGIFVDGVRVNNDLHGQIWADAQALCTDGALVQRLRELDVSALLIHGAHDMRPHWPARELAEFLPRAEFVLLENAGHFPWAEESLTLGATLRRFVAGLGAEGA